MPRALPEPRIWLAQARQNLALVTCGDFVYEITAHEDEPPYVLRVTAPGHNGAPQIEAAGRTLSVDMPTTEVILLAYQASKEILIRNLDNNFIWNNGRPFVQTIGIRVRAGSDYPENHELRTDQHWWPERAAAEAEAEEEARRVAAEARRLRGQRRRAEREAAAAAAAATATAQDYQPYSTTVTNTVYDNNRWFNIPVGGEDPGDV